MLLYSRFNIYRCLKPVRKLDKACYIYFFAGSSEEADFDSSKNDVTDEEESNDVDVKKENGYTNSIFDPTAQARLHYADVLQLPHELELRSDGAEGVWTKTRIPRGKTYGPYMGKWLQKPIDARYAWEVSDILINLKPGA